MTARDFKKRARAVDAAGRSATKEDTLAAPTTIDQQAPERAEGPKQVLPGRQVWMTDGIPPATIGLQVKTGTVDLNADGCEALAAELTKRVKDLRDLEARS